MQDMQDAQSTSTVRLEIGNAHRRYNLHVDLLSDGRAAIDVVICTPDGVILGELAGEVDASDPDEISRLLASAPVAAGRPSHAASAGLHLAPHPGDAVPASRPPAEPEEAKAYTVDEKRRLHPNAYKPWEPDDDDLLAEHCAQGVSLAELAQQFGRNEGAVASRLLKIQAKGPAVEEAWEYGG
ncbi:hypothetical protein [Streptomyces sp. NPDC056361]|uniref:hypothetical protein n=1 Tax=Streptomyces sp. NPDC056361 TaxID=3345795 RepID=UPI0035E033B6